VLDRADDAAIDLGAVERDPQCLARAAGEDQFAIPLQRRLDPLARILQRGARALIRSRASSSAARALRPSACGLDGLAQIAKPSSIAAFASGRSGEVAA